MFKLLYLLVLFYPLSSFAMEAYNPNRSLKAEWEKKYGECDVNVYKKNESNDWKNYVSIRVVPKCEYLTSVEFASDTAVRIYWQQHSEGNTISLYGIPRGNLMSSATLSEFFPSGRTDVN